LENGITLYKKARGLFEINKYDEKLTVLHIGFSAVVADFACVVVDLSGADVISCTCVHGFAVT
jgi:hypothetical protein